MLSTLLAGDPPPGRAAALADLLLSVHVVFAIASVVALPVPWVARKGGRVHILSGRLFLLLLRGTLATAVALLLLEAGGVGSGGPGLFEALEPLAGGRLRLFVVLLGLAATTWLAARVALARIRRRPSSRVENLSAAALCVGQTAAFAVSIDRPLGLVALLGAAACALLQRSTRWERPVVAHAVGMTIACLGLGATLAIVLAYRARPGGLDERVAWTLLGAAAVASPVLLLLVSRRARNFDPS